ncbi:MAG: RNA polymerase factor sigma-54 [Deltaproteobacteria bacterium]|jgi:RNA polymerase sigma-54 factor|nr:RNA polymerase factor sigma-54 [Deltaproteobacteria bacterium]
MALELKQSLKLAQQLVVTPQLQQAIKLLQLSQMELSNLVQQELLENPVLEDRDGQPDEADSEKQSNAEQHEKAKDEDRGHDHSMDEVGTSEGEMKEPSNFDWESYLDTYNAPGYAAEREARSPDDAPTYENVMRQAESLHDHLLWQLHLSNLNEKEMQIGTEIIGNINEDGYLKVGCEELASKLGEEIDHIQFVLQRIQSFDPIGVAARDIQECLILQAKMLVEDSKLVEHVIQNYMLELEKHDYSTIAKKLEIDMDKAKGIAHVISELEPKPGRPFSQESPQYITPDVHVKKVGEEYIVILNEDGLPKLRVSNFYRRALMKGSDVGKHTKEYIQERMRAAMWLIKSIHQRQRTLYRVSKSIVKFQVDFFDKGIAHLKPLVLKDVAEDIEMHESTISRVTANKYMHTPRGIFELKFFFNSGIQKLEGGGVASEAVKLMIRKMIESENPKKPLSDREIVDKLKDNNIDIARRTVAKYREMLKILPSSRRRNRD